MQRKVPSAITNITLNRATFTDVPIDELTFVNFFYGNNGAGKSSIAHAIAEDDGIIWADGKTADEIMEICRIQKGTLKYHNHNILGKLGVSSRKQMLRYATLLKQENDGSL